MLAAALLSATLFTLAGSESTAMEACWPLDDCRDETRPATERRLLLPCLTTLPDGTIVLCRGIRLAFLGADGRERAGSSAGVGLLYDADAAPDGSVLALGAEGVSRIAPDGSRTRLVAKDLQDGRGSIA